MTTAEFDVAIIGAGPAGATLATLLARWGLGVVIIDRDTFPRDKLCGEFLSYDALPVLDSLGLLDDIDRAGATRIRTCRLVGERRRYSFDFPAEARGISRRVMDELLLRHACQAGAEAFEGWTAESFEDVATGVEVRLKKLEDSRTVTARVVCGAWGRWGRFDRWLSRPFTSHRADRFFGFKRHYKPVSDEHTSASDTIDLYSFAEGYLGVSVVEQGITNICGLVHEHRLSGHRGGWPSFVDSLRSERPTLERLYGSHEPAQPEFLSSEPVVFTPRSVVERHLILIGDAAGLIDPLAGNGMAMAIQSAILVAPLIRRYLRSEIERAEMEQTYVREHSRLFQNRIQWSRRVAWLLCRPRLLDLAMSLHTPRTIGESLLRRTRATSTDVDDLIRNAATA